MLFVALKIGSHMPWVGLIMYVMEIGPGPLNPVLIFTVPGCVSYFSKGLIQGIDKVARLAVKNTACSCRRLGFKFQQPHGSSQLSVIWS